MPISVELDATAKVATVLLNGPPVNALTTELLADLKKQLQALRKEPLVRGIVFGSRLPHVVSAGLDLRTLAWKDTENAAEYRARFMAYLGLFQDCVELLLTTEVPTVSIVRGAAPAGGTVLSLCCDYRIAPSTGAFSMGLTEVAVGMAPPLWVHELAVATLGRRQADRALQLGVLVQSQQEAQRLGFVDELVAVPSAAGVGASKAEMQAAAAADWDVLYGQARARLAEYAGVPGIAGQIGAASLEHVHGSCAGGEFQGMVRGILEALAAKKAKKAARA
ncbi:enoyl-CoA hydratase/isomerase family-domain-containing protein [Entophlyctis helioformis]|nr:enoyl-CoA hydratase/isomerase family-domain-containing protein [Entophlyctis helioformis]